MSETVELGAPLAGTADRCAQCAGPLPAPRERLAVVHGGDGEILTACSTACQAGLVADLTGHTGEPAEGGGSTR